MHSYQDDIARDFVSIKGGVVSKKISRARYNTGAAGEVVKKAPMAYIPDLVPKIIQLLNENDK